MLRSMNFPLRREVKPHSLTCAPEYPSPAKFNRVPRWGQSSQERHLTKEEP